MAATRTCAVLLATCLVAACGGGGILPALEDTRPAAVTLFHDDFDSSAPEERWTLSGGVPAADAPPSALGLGETEATPSDHVFRRDGGVLEFVVAMAWPGDCPAGTAPRSRPIQVVERVSGLVLASVVVEVLPTCSEVRVEYRIDPTGTVTPSSVVGIETWSLDSLGEVFHEYVLRLHEDGLARWTRDGRTLITAFVPLADQDLVLRLGGRSGSGAPVLYDSVLVRRP